MNLSDIRFVLLALHLMRDPHRRTAPTSWRSSSCDGEGMGWGLLGRKQNAGPVNRVWVQQVPQTPYPAELNFSTHYTTTHDHTRQQKDTPHAVRATDPCTHPAQDREV